MKRHKEINTKMNTQHTYYERKNMKKSKIKDLEPFQRNLNLVFKVIKKGYSKRIHKTGSFVSECLIADDTGAILLTVWDEDIEMLETGEYFSISKGYVNIHRNKLKLNKKRYGQIEPYPDQGYDINMDNNLSNEIYDRTMTLLKSRNISPEMVGNQVNLGQDNVKIVGMNN